MSSFSSAERNAKIASDVQHSFSVALPQHQHHPNRRPAKRFSLSLASLCIMAATFDAVAITLASLLGGSGYQLYVNGTYGNANLFLAVGLVAATLFGLMSQSAGQYRDLTDVTSTKLNARTIVTLWATVVLMLSMFAFLGKVGATYSRGSMATFAIVAVALLLVSRKLSLGTATMAASRDRLLGRPVIIIGSKDELWSIPAATLLQRFGRSALRSILLEPHKHSNLALSKIEREALARAVTSARELGAAEIVLAMPWEDARMLELVRDYLRESPLPVWLLPDRRVRSLTANPLYKTKSSFLVQLQSGPLSSLDQLSKRTFDVVGSTIALALLLPIMALAALAVKLDSPGPIIFRQRRNGFNTREFYIFKFRTMSVLEDGANVTQASRNDRRITRIGKILRKSSVDELPQLLNVLKGDMSLVGPRPHALAHDSEYSKLLGEYAFRHHVKPGITGWAQAKGFRGETPKLEQMKCRIEHDIWYINNWSIWLDFKVLLMTSVAILRPKNAH